MELTEKTLREAKFRGPVAFYDGRNGWTRQDFECVEEPRFGYVWQRESSDDKGRQYYTVDGDEVPSLAAAATLLGSAPNPQSSRERMGREMAEFQASPRVGGATRALSEARCNADGGPFGMMRAWLRRADGAYHHGINAFSEGERKAERDWPSWLYVVKSAAHEATRGMYLFRNDRAKDTGLQCSYGTVCRDCPILQTIESSMREDAAREKFPAEIDQTDIDAAKVWTCIGHTLSGKPHVIDGAFFTTEADRSEHWRF